MSGRVFPLETFAARLLLALGEAGYAGVLTWTEVDGVDQSVQRNQHLGKEPFWAAYEALGPERMRCSVADVARSGWRQGGAAA